MIQFRRDISNILGVMIPENGYEKTIKDLDAAGRINNRVLLEIIIVILKKLESYEVADAQSPK